MARATATATAMAMATATVTRKLIYELFEIFKKKVFFK